MSNKDDDYLLIFRNDAGRPDPSPEELEKLLGHWSKWIDSLRKKRRYGRGDPLDDSGRVLRGKRGSKMSDGPYVEAKELVAGYMIIRAASLSRAATLAKGCPIYDRGGSVEVRRITHLEL